MRTADAANVPASTKSAFPAPRAVTSTPPAAEPMMLAARAAPADKPAARGSGRCDRLARAGSRTVRAVFPGECSRPASAIKAHNSLKCKAPVSWSTGTVITTMQQAASETTLTRQAPPRSTTVPPSREPTAAGSIVHKAMTPALPGLPVLISTNHGTPIWVMPSPATDSKVAPRRTLKARRGRVLKRRAGGDGGLASRHRGTKGDLLASGYPVAIAAAGPAGH